MELSIKERLALANQFKILEALYPDEAKMYATYQRILENGYTFEYRAILGSGRFCSELSREMCKEVWDILEMHWALQLSRDRLSDKGGIDEKELYFQGFDGNDETEGCLMAYALHIVEDLDRYNGLKHGDMNSHMPMLGGYRRMLRKWQAMPKNHELSADEIKSVLSAS